jgi:hypothetical protein
VHVADHPRDWAREVRSELSLAQNVIEEWGAAAKKSVRRCEHARLLGDEQLGEKADLLAIVLVLALGPSASAL